MADIQNASSEPTFKRAHFIGIGGAGMSGIALVLHERGFVVTGSDLKTSRYIRQLTRAMMPKPSMRYSPMSWLSPRLFPSQIPS